MSWLDGPADWVDEGLKLYRSIGAKAGAEYLIDIFEPDAKTNPIDANGPFHQLAALVQGAKLQAIMGMKDTLTGAILARDMPWMVTIGSVGSSYVEKEKTITTSKSASKLNDEKTYLCDDLDDAGDVVVKPVGGVNLDALKNWGGKGTSVLDLLAGQTYGVQLGYMFDTGRKSLGGVGIGLEALYRATNPTYLFSDVKQADFAQRYSAALSLTNLGLSMSGKWTMPGYDPTFNLSWKMPKINTTFSAMWSTSQIAPIFDFTWEYKY
jgi:hypothetical protein